MKNYIQHGNINCLDHSIYVSYSSYLICRRLGLDYRSAARGGLLHDFFLYDWHIGKPYKGLHGFIHPCIALQNANKYFVLNNREKEIIEKHMWPLTIGLPRYKETIVVLLLDKYWALIEIVKFGSKKRVNLNNKYIRRIDMKNMIDYVAEESNNFQDKEFNLVDSLALSQFAYLHFDGLVPGISNEAKPVSIGEITYKENLEMIFHGVRDRENNRKLLYALAGSPRFRNVKMTFYVDKIDIKAEKQFSALTYLLEDGTAYIAFRGTDSTFVGWKEDFNMAFISPVPSQEEGVEYLNTVAELVSCNLKIGGHSKGGNIAVYSSIKCNQPIPKMITHVFSHDGPGFRDEIFLRHEYLNMKDRIYKTIPQSSIIGILLQHQENYSVVKSNRIWIMQHDPFSWLVDNSDFHYVQTVKSSAVFTNEILNKWLSSLDDSKREMFINTLYQVVKATGATSFSDLTDDWRKKAVAVLGEIKSIDEETRIFVLKTIGSLFVLAVKNLRDIRSGNSKRQTYSSVGKWKMLIP
jgi:HD superfamily phosphodiesterase